MLSLFVILSMLAILTKSQSSQYGPYYYPTGDSDNFQAFITFGEFNASHFFLGINVYGDYWFGFGFASSHYPDGCTPNSGCSTAVDPLVGCTGTATTGCKMDGTDAIIFGNYGGNVLYAAREWTLGDHVAGFQHGSQDLGSPDTGIDGVNRQYVSNGDYWISTINVRRPYDPFLYGDRYSYTITYPLAGDFCWLWALGRFLHKISIRNIHTIIYCTIIR